MRIFLLAAVLIGIAACVSDVGPADAGKPAGTLGGPCLPSNGCDSGLTCVDSTCQKSVVTDAGCGQLGSLGIGCGAMMKTCLQGGTLQCVGDLGCNNPGRTATCAGAADCPNMFCCLDPSIMMPLTTCPDQYPVGSGPNVTGCKPSCPGHEICASNLDCSGANPRCHPAIFMGSSSVHFGVCGP